MTANKFPEHFKPCILIPEMACSHPKRFTGSNAGVKWIVFFFANNGVNSAPVLLTILVPMISITGIFFSIILQHITTLIIQPASTMASTTTWSFSCSMMDK
jgi:hypothetical protein